MLDGELRSRKRHTGAKKIKNKNKQTHKKWGSKEHLPHRVNARIKWVQSPETTGRKTKIPKKKFSVFVFSE